MTTLETIVQELQHVPPQHLDTVYELVHALSARPVVATDNSAAAARIMGAAGMLNEENDEAK